MKTNRFINLVFASLIVVTFPLHGYAEKSPASETILPPTNGVVTISVTDTLPTKSAESVAHAGWSAAPSRWIDIKDLTADQRQEFFAGLGKLKLIVNGQLNELTARRAALKNPDAIKDLDLAIQNMGNARFFLTAMGELLGKSTPQTWDQQKLKVGLAWMKTQEAYAKAKARTTS